MKRLFVMDKKDYDPDLPRFTRPSVRAVIIKNGKIAMVHSLKYDYYKFPGGGLESGESHLEAMVREVKEETGLAVKTDLVREFGSVLRIQKSAHAENEIFEQENFYYFCETEASAESQKLDAYEAEEGFTLEYIDPRTAAEVNRTHEHGGYDPALIEREARVLELLTECGVIV